MEHCHIVGIWTQFREGMKTIGQHACKYVSKYKGNLCGSPRMLNLLEVSLTFNNSECSGYVPK